MRYRTPTARIQPSPAPPTWRPAPPCCLPAPGTVPSRGSASAGTAGSRQGGQRARGPWVRQGTRSKLAVPGRWPVSRQCHPPSNQLTPGCTSTTLVTCVPTPPHPLVCPTPPPRTHLGVQGHHLRTGLLLRRPQAALVPRFQCRTVRQQGVVAAGGVNGGAGATRCLRGEVSCSE